LWREKERGREERDGLGTEISRSFKTDDLNSIAVARDLKLSGSQNLVAQSLGMSTNFDRRRINGPEESFSPVFVDDEEDEGKWRPGKPRQSRQAQDIRPICGSLSL
jgi:hypothetical protein